MSLVSFFKLHDRIVEIADRYARDRINNLSYVATSGDYNDLNNKPTIPTKTSELDNDSSYVVSDLLSDVAFSGDYDDLDNKPNLNNFEIGNDYVFSKTAITNFSNTTPAETSVSFSANAKELSAYMFYPGDVIGQAFNTIKRHNGVTSDKLILNIVRSGTEYRGVVAINWNTNTITLKQISLPTNSWVIQVAEYN